MKNDTSTPASVGPGRYAPQHAALPSGHQTFPELYCLSDQIYMSGDVNGSMQRQRAKCFSVAINVKISQ